MRLCLLDAKILAKKNTTATDGVLCARHQGGVYLRRSAVWGQNSINKMIESLQPHGELLTRTNL